MPWRAVEAMHWQLGEHEMAKRAGVTPFSLTNAATTLEPAVLPAPRPHGPFGAPPSRLRREPMAHEAGLSGTHQLPSLAELTAGLPAFSAPPYRTSDPLHHHLHRNHHHPLLYNSPAGHSTSFR